MYSGVVKAVVGRVAEIEFSGKVPEIGQVCEAKDVIVYVYR